MRNNLVKNPIFIDGMGRSGKFLLANLMSGIEDVEPVQIKPLIEMMIRRNFDCTELLRTEVDVAYLGMMRGRNLNFHVHDKSYIGNNPNYAKYKKRLLKKETNYNTLALFVTHESISKADKLFKAFPKMKLIVVIRNPVDIVYSMNRSKLNERLGIDPLSTQIPVNGRRWYIRDTKTYDSLKGMDLTIFCVSALTKMYSKSHTKTDAIVRYEDLMLSPEQEIKKIAKFLGKKVLPGLKKVIKNENLPNTERLNNLDKMKKIKSLASKEWFDKLVILEKKYKENRLDN